MKKLLITLAILALPLTAFATTAAPWSITNLTDTFIFPNLINGSAKGILVSASSTIGDGTQAGGLTINGGSTTTLNAYFASKVGIGTTSPFQTLSVAGNAVFVTNSVNVQIESNFASTNASLQLKNLTETWSLAVRGADLANSFVIRDTTAGADRFIINTSGNVGVSSTTPFARFAVKGAGTGTGVNIQATDSNNVPAFTVLDNGTASSTNFIVSSAGGVGTRCAQFATDGTISATSAACGTGAGTVTAVTATYPILSSGGTTPNISIAFGTTTSNTWAGTQTFTNSPVFSTLGAGTVNSLANGTIYSTSTSTPSVTSPITYSGTLGQFISGVSGSFGCASCVTVSTATSTITGTTGQVVYMQGTNSPIGTSSIFITPSGAIGIGTITPTAVNANAHLTVSGGGTQDVIASTTDVTTTSAAIFEAYSDTSRVFMGSHGSAQVTSRYNLASLGSWGEISEFNSTAGNAAGLVIGTNPAIPLVFGTNNVEQMRIDSTGRVGMGSTSPFAMLSIHHPATATFITLFAIASSTQTSTTTLFSVNNVGLASTSNLILSGLGQNGAYSFLRSTATGTITSVSSSTIFTGTTGQTAYFNGTNSLIGTSTVFISTGSQVGIGVTSPLATLHVKDPSANGEPLYLESGTTFSQIQFKNTNNANGYIAYDTTHFDFYANSAVNPTMTVLNGAPGTVGVGSTTPWAKLSVTNIDSRPSFIVEDSSSPDTTPFVVDASGNVGIASTTPWRTLSVVGTVAFNGLTAAAGATHDALCLGANNEVMVNTGANTCLLSSKRFKHDIATSTAGLDEVLALQPITYYYNGDTKKQQYGFIAEDVALVDPLLVSFEADGITPRSVQYENYTAVLTKAIQEIEKQVKDTFNKVASLISHPIFGTPQAPTGITLYDTDTGEPNCVKISSGQLKTTAGECL